MTSLLFLKQPTMFALSDGGSLGQLSDADGGLLGQVLLVDCRWIMEKVEAKCLIDGAS